MKRNKPRLTVVIPAYNEERRIVPTLESVKDYCISNFFLSEIIIVNDGSGDGTTAVVENYIQNNRNKKIVWKLVNFTSNHGKGFVVRRGALASCGEYILLMDADSSIPISELDKLWKYRLNFDLVIGSRFINTKRHRSQKITRMIISQLGNILSKTLFGLQFSDTQCGFKLINSTLAKRIFPKLTMNHFAYDIEMLVRAIDNNNKIKEVSIIWRDVESSTVTIFHSAWMALIELLKFWREYKNII